MAFLNNLIIAALLGLFFLLCLYYGSEQLYDSPPPHIPAYDITKD